MGNRVHYVCVNFCLPHGVMNSRDAVSCLERKFAMSQSKRRAALLTGVASVTLAALSVAPRRRSPVCRRHGDAAGDAAAGICVRRSGGRVLPTNTASPRPMPPGMQLPAMMPAMRTPACRRRSRRVLRPVLGQSSVQSVLNGFAFHEVLPPGFSRVPRWTGPRRWMPPEAPSAQADLRRSSPDLTGSPTSQRPVRSAVTAAPPPALAVSPVPSSLRDGGLRPRRGRPRRLRRQQPRQQLHLCAPDIRHGGRRAVPARRFLLR